MPDPSQQPITAADPRVAQVLALIRAQTGQVPVEPTATPSTGLIAPPASAQLQPPVSPAPPAPRFNELGAPLQPMNELGSALPTPPDAPPTAPTPGPGPVKSFLMSLGTHLLGGVQSGQAALLHQAGLPTPYEKQQNALKMGQAQQQVDALTGLRNSQAGMQQSKADQLDQLTAPYTIDKEDQSVLPQFRGAATTFGGYQALQHLAGVNQGKTDVANIAANAGAVKLTPEYAQRLGIPQLAGQTVGGKQLASLNKMLQGTGANVTEGDIGNGHVGLIDKDTRQVIQDYGPSQRMLGLGLLASSRTVQVPDPLNPDQTIQMSPLEANRLHAPGMQSVVYQANKAVTRYFTSGEGAKNLNAFNTATAHLEQLGTVADALQNGNVQIVNKLAQNYAIQTGEAAPANFDSVKAAVSGEIGKVFKGAAATDQEIAEMESTINRAQSPAQLKGVIKTYTTLMNSKRDALKQQFEQGKAGTPNFTAHTPARPAGVPADAKWNASGNGGKGSWVSP